MLLSEPAPAAAAGGSWLSTNKFKASTANEPSSDKDVTSTSASSMPAPDESALRAAACVAAAGSDLGSGLGATLGPSEEPAPEAAACAVSERGDLGGVTLGIGPKRGGLLELVGWLDLRLITHESDKGSGISAPNNHHNLRSGRCSERYPIVWRTLARVGTRRGVPEGLVPVV